MQQEKNIKWLFADLNSFFASVEQQENPSLRNKPVVVTPLESDYTCAIAASYEARAYGIKTGTIIKDAKKMCPNLLCVPANHQKYVEYHHAILEELVKHTPINKVWSIDEFSSRLPPDKRNRNSAQQIAQNIKNGLRKNIGKYIQCSVGIAPNSLLAKIASDMQKPDGLVILEADKLLEMLSGLRLRDLPGIGRNMQNRLHRARIMTIFDLWNISPKHARKIWGSVEGERFWYLLHGYDTDNPAAISKNVMIGHSRILDPQLRPLPMARLMARELLCKAGKRLRSKTYYARALSLSVRSTEGKRWLNTRSMDAAQDTHTLLCNLDIMWKDAANYFGMSPDLRIKKVSVVLHDFIAKENITEDLFARHHTKNHTQAIKNTSLTQAIDSLQEKYRKNIVSIGVPPKTLAGYVGTKIAFSRVPDSKEFWS